MLHRALRALPLAAVALWPSFAGAQLAVSANDNKAVLIGGSNTVPDNPMPDTVSIIDMNASPPRLVAEINVPASVVGPPSSVAVSPDESIAIVTAATKVDPADPKKTVPDNKVSVIDLKSSPPALLSTVEAGAGAAGVAINRAANLVLVANRSEGTVSVFTLAGKALTAAGKVQLGDAKSGPSAVSFTPDGKTALVTMNAEHTVKVLKIDGEKLEDTKREISTGVRPYPIAIHPGGKMAIVANVGRGTGDADTLNIIDLSKTPARNVGWVDLGYETAEGMMLSPDGRWCGVVVMNGSNKAKESPFFNPAGRLLLYRIDGLKLTKVAEAPIGRWSQGIAFSKDGRTILVQNMVEENAMVFRWDGAKLVDTKQPIKLGGGGAAIRTAGSL